MAFCTSSENAPSARMVLFKGMVRGGFSFYTNYTSTKGEAVSKNPQSSLLFFWRELDTQIRVEGPVAKLTDEESDSYFATRDRHSQIGAWASLQSQKIDSFETLQKRYQEFEQKFLNHKVPRPPHWGGLHLLPLKIEFWFARPGRLHERYIYERETSLHENWERYFKYP